MKNNNHKILTLISTQVFLAFTLMSCSSGGSKSVNIPEVGQVFCLDQDADGFTGYFTREASDSDADMKKLAFVTCGEPYDCDDSSKNIFFGAIEVADNGIDENCDGIDTSLTVKPTPGDDDDDDDTGGGNGGGGTGSTCENGLTPNTYYQDTDLDGYGIASISQSACEQPTGFVSLSTDCDDTNANIHPGATEITSDGIDQDCDGGQDTMMCENPDTYFLDEDNDGYRGNTFVLSCIRPQSNYYLASEKESEGTGTSCASNSDKYKYINPGMSGKDYGYLVYQEDPLSAQIIPQDIKNNMLAVVFSKAHMPNKNSFNTFSQPRPTDGFSKVTNPLVQSQFTNEIGLPEPTDGEGIIHLNFLNIDNDCDGQVDEDGNHDSENAQIIDNYDLTTKPGVYFNACDGEGAREYFTDADHDGFGDETTGVLYCQSDVPTNTTNQVGDCDDTNALINPSSNQKDYANYQGNTIDFANIDNNCNDLIDEDGVLEINERTTAIAWNGFNLSNDSTANPNTEHKHIGAYPTNMALQNDASMSFSTKTIYEHGVGNNDKFSYKNYFTAIDSNKTYMQFYTNKADVSSVSNGSLKITTLGHTIEATEFSCNNYNLCTGSINIDLTQTDAYNQSMSLDFIEGKSVVAFLSGFDFEYYSTIKQKFHTQFVNVSASETATPEIITLEFTFKFQGGNLQIMGGDIYFTVAVFDDNYVTFNELPFATNSDLPDNNSSSFDKNVLAFSELNITSTASSEGKDCTTSWCIEETLNGGVLLSSWGFDGQQNFEAHKIAAKALPWFFDYGGEGNYFINYVGIATNNSLTKFTLPNKLKAITMACADENVCRFELNESTNNGVQSSDKRNKTAFKP